MKAIFSLILSLLCGALLAQEPEIHGRVMDARHHTPVPYAALFIQGAPVGTVTNNVGEFVLAVPDSLMGRQLVVARQGFKLQYLTVDYREGREMHIALQPDQQGSASLAMQDSLAREAGGFAAWLSRAVNFVTGDWIPLGNPETNWVDFGRIQTFPTYNPIEGVRLRAGVASTSRLSPHFFVRGYVAYGFKDERFKYRGEAIYSFTPKAYHEEEFPKNNLRLVYENDLYSPGEMHPRSANDLLLITYRRSLNEATYRNFGEINYEREYKNGLAHTFWLRRSRFQPQGELTFELRDEDRLVSTDALHTAEVGVQFRYSVREAYDQRKRKRVPLDLTSPVFFLSHSIGLEDFMGGEVPYHRTEISAQKRFMLGRAGRLDIVGEAMKVWNTVPFPLLVYPNQRQRHHIENSAFFLSRALEFVADEQATLRVTFVGDELLLSKVPLLNRLGFKELVTLRAAHGRLSDKNLPGESEGTYALPPVSRFYDRVPYMEGTIGITSILGLLRVEYVHRFTYRDHPNAMLGAVRVDVTL